MDPEEAQKLAVLALKTRRNARARISRLPNELLLEIFTTLKEDLIFISQWHKVTHVCRHWRQVALESTILWIYPPTDLHEYTLLMLERSRTSPLIIHIDSSTSEDTLLAILSHIGRIKYLYIDHSEAGLELFQHHLQALGTEAAFLRSIEIAQNFSAPPSFKLCNTIFDQFLALRNLCFWRINFDWGLFPLRAPTQLSRLRLMSVELFTPISWTQFYEALQQMPSLESLAFSLDDLQLGLPLHFPGSFELPLLHSLILESSHISVVGAFLINSTFPRLENALFECFFDEPEETLSDLSTTIHAILSLIPKGSFGCLDKLHIQPRTFGLDRSSDVAPTADFRHNLELTTLDWQKPKPIKIAQELMAGLGALSTNPSAKITHLHLSAKLASKQISKLFGSLPGLEEVVTSEIPSGPIIESLRVPGRHPHHLPPLFSNVRSLRIFRQAGANSYTSELLNKLVGCLVERSQRGVGLASLFVQWDLNEEEGSRLRDIVADVVWSRMPAESR